ncbi:MAG: hypothetical protein SGPRY_014363, partial [Prymnesium sp.]
AALKPNESSGSGMRQDLSPPPRSREGSPPRSKGESCLQEGMGGEGRGTGRGDESGEGRARGGGSSRAGRSADLDESLSSSTFSPPASSSSNRSNTVFSQKIKHGSSAIVADGQTRQGGGVVEMLSLSASLHLSEKPTCKRGAGGEIIKSEAELMEDQVVALDVWLRKLVKCDPKMEEAYLCVPESKYVMRQLREDMASAASKVSEISERLSRLTSEQLEAGEAKNIKWGCVPFAATEETMGLREATQALGDFSGRSTKDRDKNLLDRPSQILRKIEEHCQSLVQAYVRQLSLDYQMAYDASRRESLMRDMKRMHTELAVDFSDFSDYGAFFSCAEAQMSEACVPVAYESSTPNCDLTNSDRVSALL